MHKKIDEDTQIFTWEKSFLVMYKGIYSGVIYIGRKPDQLDIDQIVNVMKCCYKTGQKDFKRDLKQLME